MSSNNIRQLQLTYLKFDTSSVRGPIVGAKLRLRHIGPDPVTGTFRLHRGTHDDWTRDNMTYWSAPGGLAQPSYREPGSKPHWVRLVRTGDVFTGYQSEDGVTWHEVGSQVISMPAQVEFGLCVTAHDNNQLCTAGFSNVSALIDNSGDIGNPKHEGSMVRDGSNSALQGGGRDIWSTSDQFHFVHDSATGDLTITARVDTQDETHPWAKAGVMIRNGLAPTHSTQWSSSLRNVALLSRTVSLLALNPITQPEAKGTTNGSGNDNATSTTKFTGVDIDTEFSGFDHIQDIGGPKHAGSTVHIGDVYTVQGGGYDIWMAYDQFQYAATEITGDCEIITQVVSQANTNEWAKAGVMIRAGLELHDDFAFAFVTPGRGVAFQRRKTGKVLNAFTGIVEPGEDLELEIGPAAVGESRTMVLGADMDQDGSPALISAIGEPACRVNGY